MNAAGLSTEEVPLETKKVVVTVDVVIAVLTCRSCQTKGEYIPNSLYRPTYESPWALQGYLYPKGWVQGKCPQCAKLEAAMSPAPAPAVPKQVG